MAGDRFEYIMERARILGDHVEFPSQTAKGAAIYTMTVCGTHDVRPRFVHGPMDHKCGCVQQPDLAAVNHIAVMVDLDQILLPDEREGEAEGIHPESIWLDGISKGDVTGDTFIVSILAEDPEGSGQTTFEVVPFGVLVGKGRRAGKVGHLNFGFAFAKTWFVWSKRRGFTVAVGILLWRQCRWRSHDRCDLL